MSSTQICLALVLGSLATLAGPATASAAATSSATCEAMLDELGSARSALVQMSEAVDANARHRAQLRGESAALAATIARLRARGASPSELERSIAQRDAALQELAMAEKIRPALESQHEALGAEVTRTERGYIACIEASLDR